ncbi:hypothetical protein CGT94_05070 [Vibrio metoecus]|uniref:hypothetical protein n=1 Tax=Vibrio metoecus TaxID=1481663 RepID=UPI0006D7DF5C|nr:hypothetical protein [Vibrio metoecus]KQB07360.1 hypothetical protein XV93_03625 [Vibrio metoecus]PAR50967.1 hypothetical protein CGT94_05070 [Vibrio metoecus]
MGGKSQSSNQTTTINETNSTQLTNAFNADMNGTVISGIENSTISVTDGGSVQAALKAMTDASKLSIESALSQQKVGADLSKYVVGQNTDLAKSLGVQALVNAQSATTDAMDIMKTLSLRSDAGTAQQMTKYFMFAAVAVAVAVALKGKL